MNRRAALVLALVAGVSGVIVGRATRQVPPAQTVDVSLPATPASQGCKAERTELASTKTQLAICMAYTEHPPKAAVEADEGTEETAEEREAARVRRNHEVWASGGEIVFVRRADHTLSFYLPHEPIPDGIIVARRLPSGEIGWYAGPDAGPRSDPAAFRPAEPGSGLTLPVVKREADGTITVNGQPGDPVLQRFGGRPRE